MKEINGLIHRLPKEIKSVIFVFILVLSIGFFGGLSFVNSTSSMRASGIESQYLGNENEKDAEIMMFKKSKREILTLIHNHILSMSVIFFLLAIILATTSLPSKWKYFLMIEPFISIVLTFGGLYILWLGVTWFKYVVMFSGILMTCSFLAGSVIILVQLLVPERQKK